MSSLVGFRVSSFHSPAYQSYATKKGVRFLILAVDELHHRNCTQFGIVINYHGLVARQSSLQCGFPARRYLPRVPSAAFRTGFCASARAFSVHSSLATMRHSNDDIPLFAPCFDVPVRLGRLLQRIASINDRFQLPCLNKLFEKNQVFTFAARRLKYDFFAASHRSPSPSKHR